MLIIYTYVIALDDGLLKSSDSWLWSGHHAKTYDLRDAMLFTSKRSAEIFLDKYHNIIKDITVKEIKQLILHNC